MAQYVRKTLAKKRLSGGSKGKEETDAPGEGEGGKVLKESMAGNVKVGNEGREEGGKGEGDGEGEGEGGGVREGEGKGGGGGGEEEEREGEGEGEREGGREAFFTRKN